MRTSKESNEKTGSDKEKNQISAPSITLSKGGGTFRGIGGKFCQGTAPTKYTKGGKRW